MILTSPQKQKVLFFFLIHLKINSRLTESRMVTCLPHTVLKNEVSIISYLGKELLETGESTDQGYWYIWTSTKKGIHFIFSLMIPPYILSSHIFQPKSHWGGYIPTFSLSQICKQGSCANSPDRVLDPCLICEYLSERASWTTPHISAMTMTTWENLAGILSAFFLSFFFYFP